MAELGVQPPTGLYPQPPAPPSQGALSDPTKMMDLFGSMMRNQVLQNELKGRAAVGQAVQDALGPGGFDIGAFTNSLKNNPDAAWMAPEALQQGQNNARAQFERMMAIQQQVRQLGGSLSENSTKEDFYNAFTTAVRGGVPPAEAVEMLSAISGSRNKAGVIAQFRNFGLTPLEQSQRTEIQPGPGGIRQTAPLTRANQGGVIGTTQPIGEQERQIASAAGAAELEATGRTTSGYHSNLENLKQDSKIMENLGGPTIETEKKLNQLSQRIGGFGITMSTDQLRALESFDKIANQISQQQASSFHGSDLSLHTSVASNPSSGMSRYGREGVIDMLQGNQDAIDRTRGLWFEARKSGAPASSFNDFMERTSKAIDPRIFQFNRMSADNQKKFAQDLDPGDVDEFKRKYRNAVEQGWVKPPKGGKQSQSEPAAPAQPPKPGKQSQAQPPASPAKSDRATYPRYEYRKPGDMGEESRAEPPVPGARLAADGQWYVRQPHANGDYQRVVVG